MGCKYNIHGAGLAGPALRRGRIVAEHFSSVSALVNPWSSHPFPWAPCSPMLAQLSLTLSLTCGGSGPSRANKHANLTTSIGDSGPYFGTKGEVRYSVPQAACEGQGARSEDWMQAKVTHTHTSAGAHTHKHTYTHTHTPGSKVLSLSLSLSLSVPLTQKTHPRH